VQKRDSTIGRLVSAALSSLIWPPLQALPGFWTGKGPMLYCLLIFITEHL